MNALMLVLQNQTSLEAWLNLALRMAGENGTIHVRVLMTISSDESASAYVTQVQEWRNQLNQRMLMESQIEDDLRLYVDQEPMQDVIDELRGTPTIDTLLVQWSGPDALTGGVDTETLLVQVPCDVVLLMDGDWHESGPVLLSLRGGPNITLGVEMAKALCGDSSITLFHAADLQRSAPDLEVVMRNEEKITRSITAVTRLARGIAREAREHKVVVLGAGFRRPEGSKPAAPGILQQLRQQISQPLALVRARRPEAFAFHAPYQMRSSESDLSRRVDRWFAQNSFHSHEFADLSALMVLKEKRGLSISVGLPALNEEATIENVIRSLKGSLMDDVPLVDEIVLIDSNSTDNTVPLAEACGIPVYRHPELLPEVGSVAGKGEALWKSLSVLKGDLIVWVDTDITNIHPRFVYGLVGPLLQYPHLNYIKGYYQRPIEIGNQLQAVGGGRVTELVARPMMNLFYPELSGFLQPLAGEYAGRRTALEQVPFFSGYGVETGLLLDLHERFGLESLAQVDLETRIHYNQPLDSLSRMAFAILQVFIARLESRYGVRLLDVANRSMKVILQDAERLALDVKVIGDIERPPMLTLPDYAARRTALSAD